MITLKNVSKFYYNKGIVASGFSKINLELKLGEFVAITGESGSGKSTLLNVISGLDSYEEGEMYINGEETSHYTELDFEEYRRKYISNIFQNFNLVNSYTVKENIELVMLLNGKNRADCREEVKSLIKKVGLTKYQNTKVSKLSGGQKQRVAIARALAKDTPVLIADEPTGNLDSKAATGIIKLLHEISASKLVIIVTHNYEQVEPYVTRKIKMHDGKILEDKVLKKTEPITYQPQSKIETIKWTSKLRLGLRNTFNILPKFILVLLVYLFITCAVMSEYAFFKKQIYLSGKDGYNNFFIEQSDTRLVIKKKDKTPLLEEDYQKIEKLKHVDHIVKNDLLLDSNIQLEDEKNFYYYGTLHDIKTLNKKVSLGTLPTNEDEILIAGSPNDYYLSTLGESIIGLEVKIRDNSGNSPKDKKYKIVGIAYDDTSNSYNDGKIYGLEPLLNDYRFLANRSFSDLKVLFQNEYHNSNMYDSHYQVIPNDKVPAGSAYITSDLNPTCKNSSCQNEPLAIEVKNLYYQEKLNLKVTNTYTKQNINTLLGNYNYEEYNGAIFVNQEDYNKLFNKEDYQSSVFVDDVSNLEEVSNHIEKLGISTLKIKDTLILGGVVEAMKIIRTIVTALLLITLFFISYFVIRIILKSRNIYFGTIRILGARKKDAKQLLEIELLAVSNLAYIAFCILLLCNHNGLIINSFLATIVKYLKISDYLLLYIIIMLMSYLISIRFAGKIFKNSAMTTMREEV